jgi:hypothetical protein
MQQKTFGSIHYNADKKKWIITKLAPQVCIRLKAIFPKIATTSVVPFVFDDKDETCSELQWFMQQYPLEITDKEVKRLNKKRKLHAQFLNEVNSLFTPDYTPRKVTLKEGMIARHYQKVANDLLLKVKRYVLGDDLGLGKTVSGILGFFHPSALPAAVVCQTHLTHHWVQQIEKFTYLKVHVIKTRKCYDIPAGTDVCIFSYTKLQGWVDTFASAYFRYALFDEVQELRNATNSQRVSKKYEASKVLSINAEYVLGMTATPIYIKAENIFHILNLIKEGCLGRYRDFEREWGYNISDRPAFGSYLRDSALFLRRTRADVGMELPEVNVVEVAVEYDQEMVDNEMDLLRKLAVVITTGSFTERGDASRQFDLRLRQITGISKAKYVAAFVKMLLDNNEPVILFGWHREVYAIWDKELAAYKPCYYTGTETPGQKNNSKEAYINGETNLLIMSLASGAGLDGLQHRGNVVVFGELDHSPEKHRQCIGRVDRDGQTKRVDAFFVTCNDGSDPPMIAKLAEIKNMSFSILNPFSELPEQHSDDSGIKAMAEYILNRNKKNEG